MITINRLGSSNSIIEIISDELCIKEIDSERIFSFLDLTYENNTVEFGKIIINNNQHSSLLIDNNQYYINLPKSLLIVIAFLLDVKLTSGIISLFCDLVGVDNQVLYKINQKEAENCILREYLRNKSAKNPKDYYYLLDDECVNNDLSCPFRNERDCCTMNKENIRKALSRLKEIKVIN